MVNREGITRDKRTKCPYLRIIFKKIRYFNERFIILETIYWISVLIYSENWTNSVIGHPFSVLKIVDVTYYVIYIVVYMVYYKIYIITYKYIYIYFKKLWIRLYRDKNSLQIFCCSFDPVILFEFSITTNNILLT